MSQDAYRFLLVCPDGDPYTASTHDAACPICGRAGTLVPERTAAICGAAHVSECPDGAYCPVHGIYKEWDQEEDNARRLTNVAQAPVAPFVKSVIEEKRQLRAKILAATAALDAFGEEVYSTIASDVETRWVWDRIQRVMDILSDNPEGPLCTVVSTRAHGRDVLCGEPRSAAIHSDREGHTFDSEPRRSEDDVRRRYVRRFGQEAWDKNWKQS